MKIIVIELNNGKLTERVFKDYGSYDFADSKIKKANALLTGMGLTFKSNKSMFGGYYVAADGTSYELR